MADAAPDLAALTGAFLRAVTFAAGETPDYERIRDLFVDGGRLIRNDGDAPEIATVDEFIAPRRRMVEAGELTWFEETESSAIDESFGNVAHRFSTYTKCGELNGTLFEARGVITTQFVRTPAGWKMSSMAWDDERPGLSIPDRYA
jgi:hypothetical protein